MRLCSFNINGIRARPHQLEAIRDRLAPDVIGLQETKVQDAEFPVDAVRALGYHVEWFGQKGHYGVAILSKEPPLEVIKGFEGDADDAQRRFIAARFATATDDLWVLNGYFPQGESRAHPTKFPAKRDFYAALRRHLGARHHPGQWIAVMGDMNIAPRDMDIGIGPDNAKRWLKTGKCSFLPEEREWMEELLDWGLVDSYRLLHPRTEGAYSWFDYRSKGFEQDPPRGLRIDQILVTHTLAEHCKAADIALDIRAMDKPSDHCPLWVDVDC